MIKIRFISVLLLISFFAALTGCGGSGGSSTPVEKDVAGITSTLNGYMASLRANDSAAAARFFAATAPTSPTSPGSIHTILIEDFGINISDNTDKPISYNFLVYPEDIVQPSNEIAFVKATYTLHSGAKIILKFSLVKENGVWLIDNMESETTTGSDSSTTPGSFIAKSFYPIQENITRMFALTDSYDAALTDRIYEIFSYSYDDSDTGIKFYELSETETVPGNADYEGAPAPASSQRASRKSLRANTAPFFYHASSIYFGYDSAGALWMKTPESNYGVPFKLLESSHAYGSSREIGLFWYDSSEALQTGTVTVNIGYPTEFSTPLQSYTAVSLTFLTSWNNGADQHKWVLHLASGIGTVGADHFFSPSSPTPDEKERIMQRFSSDYTLNQRNDPAISTAVNLGSYHDGQTITSVQLTSTGGTAPYTYSLDSSSFAGTGVSLTSSGNIAGSIAGTPALGDYSTVIKVVDKFGRYSTKTFNMTVVASPPVSGAVTYSPSLPGTMTVGGSHQAWVMLNNAKVKLADYIFELTNKSPVFGFVNVGSDASGDITINVTGDSATTLQFAGKLTSRSDSTVNTSELVTVVIAPASIVTFSPAYSSSGENISSASRDWEILIEGAPVVWTSFPTLYTYSFENVSPSGVYDPVVTSGNKIGIGPYNGNAGFWAMSYPGTVYFELVITRISDNKEYRSGVLSYTSLAY